MRAPRLPLVLRHRRFLGVPVALLAIVLTAVAAVAYFTSTGSGSGSGTTGALQTVTVAAISGTETTPLLPGASGDVILRVTNPNPYSVTLVNVAGNGTISADGSHTPGCVTTGIVTFSDQTGLTQSIAGNGATTAVDLPGAAHMSLSAANACQGATFSIQVSVTVHK
jgi:hypothetical protein